MSLKSWGSLDSMAGRYDYPHSIDTVDFNLRAGGKSIHVRSEPKLRKFKSV